MVCGGLVSVSVNIVLSGVFLLPPSHIHFIPFLSPQADNSYHLTVLLHHTAVRKTELNQTKANERDGMAWHGINAAFNSKLLMVLFAVQ